MDKLKFEPPDMVAGNIDKIGELFSGAVTEMQGEDVTITEAACPITKALRLVKEDIWEIPFYRLGQPVSFENSSGELSR